MLVRRVWASVIAGVVVLGGVSLVAAPAASASPVTCPTVAIDGTVTPAPSPGVNWSGCNLSGADLNGADLSGADLNRADLSGADLSGADLTDTELSVIDLRDTDLTGADLSGAAMTDADLTGAFVTCDDDGILGTGISALGLTLPSGWALDGGTLTVPVAPCTTVSASPIPAWVQAYGRASADATCLEGWNPSWDLWPNDGKGGFVCQRSIPSLG